MAQLEGLQISITKSEALASGCCLRTFFRQKETEKENCFHQVLLLFFDIQVGPSLASQIVSYNIFL